ncbi:hypothetical protein IH601_05965 [Candidatus Bipolaricaulota bacterium]|jgi:hypothetical protein|nr:hypothetical protein [Candidatus Bipolaricaulota bacterium]TFH10673.1 MAG: hypothetical protein E4H08_03060 [Candidatus Atribacteria bacterium]
MESVHATQGCCGGEASAHRIVASSCCDGHEGAQAIAAHQCCGFSRHYITKAERKEALEQYRDQLQKELTGVEEHLQDMK